MEQLCYLMTSWLTLCMSAERLLMLQLPLLKQKMCAGKRSCMVVLVLSFSSHTHKASGYFTLIMWKAGVRLKNKTGLCFSFCTFTFTKSCYNLIYQTHSSSYATYQSSQNCVQTLVVSYTTLTVHPPPQQQASEAGDNTI